MFVPSRVGKDGKVRKGGWGKGGGRLWGGQGGGSFCFLMRKAKRGFRRVGSRWDTIRLREISMMVKEECVGGLYLRSEGKLRTMQ